MERKKDGIKGRGYARFLFIQKSEEQDGWISTLSRVPPDTLMSIISEAQVSLLELCCGLMSNPNISMQRSSASVPPRM
jgi:hypothetical protein